VKTVNKGELSMPKRNDQSQMTELVAEALQAFVATTGLPAEVAAGKSARGKGAASDAFVRVGEKKKPLDFAVEARERVTSAGLGALAMEFRQPARRSLLVTSYVTPHQAEELRQRNIPFLDTAGNAFLNEPSLFVFVTGKRPTAPRLPTKNFSQAFRPSGLGILFALLRQPGLENQPMRDIAAVADVSLGAVSWELKQLEQAGYLLNSKTHGRRLLKQGELFKRWIEAYHERWRPKLLLARCSASRPDWWKGKDARLKQHHACWGGEVAAEKLTNYLKPQTQTIYTRGTAKELQLEFELKRDPQGDIEILQAFWSPLEETPQSTLAPELLVYADLLGSADERNLETAQMIYDRYLVRLIGEATT
jgi:hypothetical protein